MFHIGAFDYAAPEIIDLQLYDEKSDIWSIGSIMLDACTTGLYDVNFSLLIANYKYY